jgi:glycosyltransferase involved in cell wall biosynthesis
VKLADAICDILTKGDPSTTGDAMRRRAAEKFSLERMLDETERVYTEIWKNRER